MCCAVLEFPSNSAYSLSSMNSPSDVIISCLKVHSEDMHTNSGASIDHSYCSIPVWVSSPRPSGRLYPGLSDFHIYLHLLILFIVVYNLHWFFSLFYFIDSLKFFVFTLTPHKVFLFIRCLLTIRHIFFLQFYSMLWQECLPQSALLSNLNALRLQLVQNH